MKRYKGSGNVGVYAYDVVPNGIILQFVDGSKYLYDSSAPGKTHIREMLRLAEKGQGLTTYINQHVRGNYKTRLN
ncbi:hypothetical protein EXU57_09970 [Segetibacter sp. 3557_3]|uniref:hypothetical protein n=1 Tax=Segetibacter sp. 3557_3 TaxID=2547429 RepID=UPI00105863D7|nr:hypothetical protein [Segetibacter sp. 3557_3]TDH26415.1 hypothetical protein EXU57_09970 [Segetibacter sp. 3557_3]